MRFLLVALLFCTTLVHARELTDLRTYGEPAPNTLYLFVSPDCSHCRDFHKTLFPEILKRFVNTKKAQVFIVDMPTKERAIQAVMLMRCLPDDKADKMMGWLYENQNRWKRAPNARSVFSQYAQTLGMSLNDFNNCLDNDALKHEIISQYEQLRVLYQVRGTPTTVLRQGNVIRHYVGTDRKAVLHGLEKDIADYEKQQNDKSQSH